MLKPVLFNNIKNPFWAYFYIKRKNRHFVIEVEREVNSIFGTYRSVNVLKLPFDQEVKQGYFRSFFSIKRIHRPRTDVFGNKEYLSLIDEYIARENNE